MVGALIRSLARVLARALHGAAAGLDGLSARLVGGASASPDPALAALAERFPGAPEHWLAYIAARAPGLAGAGTTRAAGRSPAERRSPARVAAPDRADAEPRRPAAPEVSAASVDARPSPRPSPGDRPRRAPPPLSFRPQSNDPASGAPTPALKLAPDRPTPRPRLVFADPGPRGDPGPPPGRPSDQAAAGSLPGALALGALSPAAAPPSPAAPESGVRRPQPPAPPEASPPLRSVQPRLALADGRLPRNRAEAVAPWWPPRPRRTAPVATSPQAGPSRRPDPPVWAWSMPSSSTATRPGFAGPAARPAAARWPEPPAEPDPWPALPPWTPEIADAPVPAPDLGRLRAAQDENQWSG